MRRAVKKAGIPWNLTVLMDGQQAINLVAGMEESATPLPALVFLDLKLPYVSGFEVLASMRASERFRTVPIIILTSSPEERDQRKALELGANAYHIKPPTEEMLRNAAGGRWGAAQP